MLGSIPNGAGTMVAGLCSGFMSRWIQCFGYLLLVVSYEFLLASI